MRVLLGMRSASSTLSERDALYPDFFDEEEEFERIVIDKTKKGEGTDVERAAAEQVAEDRVEREHHIEAAHERAEPLRESALIEDEVVAEVEASEPAETGEQVSGGTRRRGRRGRRRGRGQDGEDTRPQLVPEVSEAGAHFSQEEVIYTPFVAADPSIQRIVDDEEAAVNGEMFKDARLQERLLDQIHAGEFNLGEDMRTAEVGSLLSADFGDSSFQRIDDSDISSQTEEAGRRQYEPVSAHLDSFSDEAGDSPLNNASFERISDDDDEAPLEDDGDSPQDKAAKAREKKKRGGVKAAAPKATRKKPATAKKTATKKRAKAAGETISGDSAEPYEDGEARITDGNSRAEFATRRGGRRRRRPAKPKTETNGASAPEVMDDSVEVTAANDETVYVEPLAPEPVEIVPAPVERPQPREQREQRERRPQSGRGNRNIPRRERHQPTITDLLKEGQEILVQIAKEPIAKKGARITSHIALPGRFLVYMPTVEHVGVSRKIDSDGERHRLRKLIQVILASEDIPSGGFIVRGWCRHQ